MPARVEKTGECFLSAMLAWLDEAGDQMTARVLWLRGKPGSGKSSLTSASVQRYVCSAHLAVEAANGVPI